jgi:serine phosphatase RsbU (regulator of sigma subunit)
VQGSPIDVRSGEAAASGNAPVAASVIAAGKAIAVSDMFVDSQFNPKELQRLDVRSALGAPLIMRDKLTGAIAFRFKDKREFTPADIDFVEKLAAAISLGMENAELFRTEKETRADIQGYAVQLSILHEIGISLNRETSIPRLRDIIVRSATSLTSSGVSFMTMSVDGGSALGPVSHAPWMAAEEPVIDDDVTLLHDHLMEMAGDKDRYAFRVTDPEQLPWFPQKYAGLGDLLVGVIRDTRGRIRALFVMGAKFEGGSFGRSDEDIISLLAAQSSVAMTSAESFEKEHDIAETLQTALLPDIPVRGDMEIGLLYRSASSAGRIGGDFYDFGELDTNVVSFAVGDVCGKGLSAASHTAMVKFMLRAYLEEGRSPGECLTLLNESLCKNIEPDKFITLALAVIDVGAGKIRYSLAGHPLPIISRDGEVVELEVPQTIPLGVIPGYSFSTVETFFNPSTSMVMYTDGLLEARSRDEEQFGAERLAAEFSNADGLSAQHLAQNIVDKVLEFSGDELQDDVALVVVRALQQYDY